MTHLDTLRAAYRLDASCRIDRPIDADLAAEAGMEAGPIEVEVGDTLDFVVDVADGLDSDQFVWAPGVAMADGRWAAADGFPATGPGPDYLQPWEQYAQVLLLSNEFAFVD